MPDQTTLHTLTPPVGSAVVFNDGDIRDQVSDIYYITDIQGLDTADLRLPRFPAPVTNGARLLPGYEHGLEPRVEGAFIIQSVSTGNAIRARRMEMYAALKTALRACVQDPGTWTWTESGVGAMSLSVQYQVKLAHSWDAGYQLMLFTFGLASEASQPS